MNYTKESYSCFGEYKKGYLSCNIVCRRRNECALPIIRKEMEHLTLKELPKYLTDDNEVVRTVAKEMYSSMLGED